MRFHLVVGVVKYNAFQTRYEKCIGDLRLSRHHLAFPYLFFTYDNKVTAHSYTNLASAQPVLNF